VTPRRRRGACVAQRPQHPPTSERASRRCSASAERQGATGGARFTRSLARARLRGVQVFFCSFSVIVVQQLAGISLLDGPRPRRMNWPFRDSLSAVKRRAGACRPMQVTVRIRLLRATRTTGAFTGDRLPLPKLGIPLAEACRAGTSDGWRPGSRERSSSSRIGSAGRHDCDMPGGIRETSRRADRTRRAFVALDFAAKDVSAASRAERSVR